MEELPTEGGEPSSLSASSLTSSEGVDPWDPGSVASRADGVERLELREDLALGPAKLVSAAMGLVGWS